MTVEAQVTITDFLLARIAEDKKWAEEETFQQPWRFDAARVLAECEAYREIIGPWAEGEGRETIDLIMQHPETDFGPHRALLVGVFRALAAIWQDHPDYRPEWRAPFDFSEITAERIEAGDITSNPDVT